MSDTVAIIGALATGIVAIIAAVAAAYGAVQSKKTHTLVNSRTDDMIATQLITDARVDQLEEELRGRGDGSVPKAK